MTTTNDLRQITYVSTAPGLLTDEQLRVLVDEARRNNIKNGITGFMVYAEGNIMQIIEGPSDRIEILFDAIRQDPRHDGVMRVLDTRTDFRSFPDWPMGFARRNSLKGIEGALDLQEAREKLTGADDTPQIVHRILSSFITNNAPV